MLKRSGLLLLVFGIGFGAASWIARHKQLRDPVKRPNHNLSMVTSNSKLGSVSGLGTIEPVGEVHNLAAPITQLGVAPRITSINVAEGDSVNQNQILATFDNLPQLLAETARIKANVEKKKIEIDILETQTGRFEQLVQTGSLPIVDLEERKIRLAGFQSQLQELMGAMNTSNERLISDTVIRSPINGIVLKTNARIGERAQADGVFEIANTNKMQGIIQVDEADISSIRIGQAVILRSENGAFRSNLNGKVRSISLKVTYKKKLGQDPILDPGLEKRVIEVKVDLDPESSQKTRRLTGIKIIGIFKAL